MRVKTPWTQSKACYDRNNTDTKYITYETPDDHVRHSDK